MQLIAEAGQCEEASVAVERGVMQKGSSSEAELKMLGKQVVNEAVQLMQAGPGCDRCLFRQRKPVLAAVISEIQLRLMELRAADLNAKQNGEYHTANLRSSMFDKFRMLFVGRPTAWEQERLNGEDDQVRILESILCIAEALHDTKPIVSKRVE